MANRVEYAVSVTPVKSTTFGVDYAAGDVTDLTGQAHDYIHPEVAKTLGGSGTISGIAATVSGYGNATDGEPDYLNTSTLPTNFTVSEMTANVGEVTIVT